MRKAKQLAFHPLRGPFLNSPYNDGERGSVIDDFANDQRCKKGASVAASFFLSVTIRGEMPGRAMRGSADAGKSGGASVA
ncbi:hypothetical protein FJ948_03905 [Mesorhizobium sp. B2-3-12]|nr:hypothetical protein FJ948_03905 [Mesorhizobium sp. B2-3-12]